MGDDEGKKAGELWKEYSGAKKGRETSECTKSFKIGIVGVLVSIFSFFPTCYLATGSQLSMFFLIIMLLSIVVVGITIYCLFRQNNHKQATILIFGELIALLGLFLALTTCCCYYL